MCVCVCVCVCVPAHVRTHAKLYILILTPHGKCVNYAYVTREKSVCNNTSLPLGTPVCALCSVVVREEESGVSLRVWPC